MSRLSFIAFRRFCTAVATCVAGCLCCYAQPSLQVVGTATSLPHPLGIDEVFIMSDLATCYLQTPDNNPVWWRLNGTDSTIVATGVDYLYPEDNTGYILHTDNGRVSFWVLDYSQYKPDLQDLLVDTEYDNSCRQTHLLLQGNVPKMSYGTISGIIHTISRTCSIKYYSLQWSEEEWIDSLCVHEQDIATSFLVDAPLRNTIFTLYTDQFAEELGFLPDSIVSAEYEAVAVDAHPTTITTVRGTEEDNKMSNEVERPVDATQLSGSAPLDIYFKANATTPVARYYQWQILKGNDLMVQRTDAEHRYVFDTYGEYCALLWVSNDECRTDSFEIKISVSASQLLVPNVFTPNGDGKNDEFRVMYRSITEFSCWIYNRWGKKVFEFTDPAKGWDGNINGRPAAESAYFYVIRAKGADGVEYKLKGDINLIRGKK